MPIRFFAILIAFVSVPSGAFSQNEFRTLTAKRQKDLKLSTYVTAATVRRLAGDEETRAKALATLHAMGISRVFTEVLRGGTILAPDELIRIRDWLEAEGFEVVGGIATVPGGEFGERQQGQLGWLNWQSEKTQQDVEAVMRVVAPLYDAFIIDDFFCTADTSDESAAAKGNRTYPAYRRDLMAELSRTLFIGPAKDENPDLTLIIKYPQWYDRFHIFGYAPSRTAPLFDQVWVGTETRGAATQRFGFTQPYEGFVNYRWIRSIAGKKVKGAWFDHGDCLDNDFLDQAYMSVLAGAPELVLFNFGDLMRGHPDHERLRQEFDHLADLAAHVRDNPVTGIPGYKPPVSDPGNDIFLMDFLGMLGIPVVPVSVFPEEADTVLLYTASAADADLVGKVRAVLRRGATVVLTAGLTADEQKGVELARLAGVAAGPGRPTRYPENEKTNVQEQPFELYKNLVLTDAETIVSIGAVPYLTRRKVGKGTVYLLNTWTYTADDYLAAHEVLLSPRSPGFLELKRGLVNQLRSMFNENLAFSLDAPTRVSIHPLGPQSYMIQNFNEEPVTVSIECHNQVFFDVRNGQPMDISSLSIAGRSRTWLRDENGE